MDGSAPAVRASGYGDDDRELHGISLGARALVSCWGGRFRRIDRQGRKLG